MNTKKTNNTYYNDFNSFCIYFYKLLRKTDDKAYKVKTDKKVIEFYNNCPLRLEFITSQWNSRREITKSVSVSNLQNVDEVKRSTAWKESYKNNPELQKLLSDLGKATSQMRLDRGDYETEEFHDHAVKMGKARQALLDDQGKSDLGKLANSSRTKEGKSKAGKARAAVTNSTLKECIHCGELSNPRTHAQWHGDSCVWSNISPKEFFEWINKDEFTNKDMDNACSHFNVSKRAKSSDYIIKIKHNTYRIQ